MLLSSDLRGLGRHFCLLGLLLGLVVGLPGGGIPAAGAAELSADAGAEGLAGVATLSLFGAGAPVPSVSGGSVNWVSVGAESSYKVALSNDARGTSDRTTRYLSIARVPGSVQSYSPALAAGETVYVGVSADGGLTWSEAEAIVSLPVMPVLSVSGGSVNWVSVGAESSYKVALSNDARGTSDRTTRYLSIARVPGSVQSYSPALAAGETVYVGVSADGGLTWSETEVAISLPAPEPEPEPEPESVQPPAPVLSVHGDTISWTAIPGVSSYKLATVLNPTTTRETTYTVVTGTSLTPPAVPGQTVNYGLRAGSPSEGPWAREVTIAYPQNPTGEPPPPPPPPPPAGMIIGTNNGAGWGSAVARTILNGHIKWNRVEIGSSSNTLATSLLDGFRVLAIVGNVDDGTPLSQVNPSSWATNVIAQLRANPGISIAEAGNEMYLKGGAANPIRYGHMYLDAVNAMKLAGIHVPLLFNMTGDYALGSWSSPAGWSQDAHTGGWLRDAVEGVPGLAQAILADGISTHPYGAVGENEADAGGVDAVAAQESVARAVLGAVPSFYITEFGYDLGACGSGLGACSQQEQASEMRAAYGVFLADPHVAGIWWYQSHDDGTGQWGYMNADNTTRPSFEVLSSIAVSQGQ